MQRDMDLIRKIMLAIEASPTPELTGEPLIKDYSDVQVNEHIRLLREAGYITAIVFRGDGQIAFAQIRLLWPGHEFLALARDDGIWNKAKAQLGNAFNTVSLAVIADVLTTFIKIKLGLNP